MRSSRLATALSKKVSQKGEEPEISLIGFTVTPGWSMGRTTKLIPSCFGASGSVRTSANIQFAYCAPLVQIFCPLMINWSPSKTALVCRPARSEPAPGSEYPWHHWASPETILGMCRALCSSVPSSRIVGPIIASPMPVAGGMAFIRAISSARTLCSSLPSPPPPY